MDYFNEKTDSNNSREFRIATKTAIDNYVEEEFQDLKSKSQLISTANRKTLESRYNITIQDQDELESFIMGVISILREANKEFKNKVNRNIRDKKLYKPKAKYAKVMFRVLKPDEDRVSKRFKNLGYLSTVDDLNNLKTEDLEYPIKSIIIYVDVESELNID